MCIKKKQLQKVFFNFVKLTNSLKTCFLILSNSKTARKRVVQFCQTQKQLENVFSIFSNWKTARNRVFQLFQPQKQLENVVCFNFVKLKTARKVRFKKVSERGFFSKKIEKSKFFWIYVSYEHESWCDWKNWLKRTFWIPWTCVSDL